MSKAKKNCYGSIIVYSALIGINHIFRPNELATALQQSNVLGLDFGLGRETN